MPQPKELTYKDALKEKKRRKVRDHAIENFGFFCRQVMHDPNNRNLVDLAPFHREYCDWLQSHGERTGFKSLTLFPRAHLKTELGDKDYSLWRWLRDPNIRIAIFNAIEDTAQSFLHSIRLEILHNDRLHYVFYDEFKDVTERGLGNQSEITLPRTARLRDATFTAYGMRTTTAGHRYDLGIYDDIVPEPSPDRPHTIEYLHAINKWFSGTLFLRDSFTKSDVSVIGTRWHDADTYGMLIKDPAYKQFVRVVETDDVPIWPEKWPIEAIIAERERFAREGQLSLFLAQMYQDPVPAGERKLGGYKLYDKLPPPEDIDAIILATDPASSLRTTACFTAQTLIFVTKYRDIYVDFSSQKRMDPSKILDDVFNLRLSYGIFTWVPEKVGFQDILRPLAYQRMVDKGLFFPIDPATRPNNIRKPDYILGAIEPYVASGRLFIRDTLTELMRQLNRFPHGEEEDAIDALAMALNKVQPGQVPSSHFNSNARGRYLSKHEQIWKHALSLTKQNRPRADEYMGDIY